VGFIQKLLTTLQCHGVAGTAAIALKRPLKSTRMVRERIRGQNGLEIGGPSPFFRTFLPIYDCINSLDNCVFASNTIWEGEVKAPFVYHPSKSPGRNYISEGSDLGQFQDASYDFVLSCHNLEHIANPVKALREWIRVLKPGGSLILVLPDGRKTFDWRRPATAVSHMLDDYRANVAEDDLTHLEEILSTHDLRKDPSAGTLDNFRRRSLDNFKFRSLHHHVFHPGNVRELLNAVGLKVDTIETALPFHISALSSRVIPWAAE
jgi:hypothetical protein